MEIAINPGLATEEMTGGLCGKWSARQDDLIECNFIDKNGECIKLDNLERIISQWR